MSGPAAATRPYVAQALAERLGIAYVSNDAIIWQPDWRPTSDEERVERTETATRGEAWAFDGNVSATQDRIVLDRCDTIVWLDLPRWQVHGQVLWRTLTHLVSGTAHSRDGNCERWSMFFSRDSIVLLSIKLFADRRRRYRTMFVDSAYADRARIRLTSRADVRHWLSTVEVTESA